MVLRSTGRLGNDHGVATFECHFCNGALFETEALPKALQVLATVEVGIGTAEQQKGLEGKALIVGGRTNGKQSGRVVLSGGHIERYTETLEGVAGMLEQCVSAVFPRQSESGSGSESESRLQPPLRTEPFRYSICVTPPIPIPALFYFLVLSFEAVVGFRL